MSLIEGSPTAPVGSIAAQREAAARERAARQQTEGMAKYAQSLYATRTHGLLAQGADGVANLFDTRILGFIPTTFISDGIRSSLRSELNGAETNGILASMDRILNAVTGTVVRTLLVSTGWLTEGPRLNESLIETRAGQNGLPEVGLREPLQAQVGRQIDAMLTSHPAFAGETATSRAEIRQKLMAAVADGIQDGTVGSQALMGELMSKWRGNTQQVVHERVSRSVNESVMATVTRMYGADITSGQAAHAADIAARISGVQVQVNGEGRATGFSQTSGGGGIHAWLANPSAPLTIAQARRPDQSAAAAEQGEAQMRELTARARNLDLSDSGRDPAPTNVPSVPPAQVLTR